MSRRIAGLAFFVLAAASALAQVERVSYAVEYRADVLDRAFVTTTLHGKPEARVSVEIPRWSPGAYEIQNFWKFLENVRAEDANGKEVALEKEGDIRWNLAAEGAAWPLKIVYERRDQRDGIGPRSAMKKRKQDYVSFLPTNTFLYVVGRKDVPHEARFVVPQSWSVRMSLPKGEGAHAFAAANYDEIVDAPVELGHLLVRNFTVGEATYAVVLDRRDPDFPLTSLEDMCRRTLRHQIGMFGGKAPWTHYEFHFHEGIGWGLEHLTSQTNGVPIAMMKSVGVGLFDALVAHETFHAWNVKRLRPKALGPFDYTGPCRTKHLWFSEGVTDYYADLTCRRTGLWHDRKFLDSLKDEIEKLQNTKARLKEPISEASWQAFDRGYMAQITGQALDYYNKGKLLGLCLDLLIRSESKGAKSLDDVMRGLYVDFALPKPGFEDDALAKEMSRHAGFDLAPWFVKYVDGTEELPFAEMFATVGVTAEQTAPNAASRRADADDSAPRPSGRVRWKLRRTAAEDSAECKAYDAWVADVYTEKVAAGASGATEGL